MIDDSILTKLKKTKRKKLINFIYDHDRDGRARLYDSSSRYLTTNREDEGTVILFMVSQSNYHEGITEFYVLIDTLDIQGRETFQKRSHRIEDIRDFVGIEPRNKGGRPRKVLTDQEKARIDELRQQSKGYNAIAKELGIGNRIVIEYCKG